MRREPRIIPTGPGDLARLVAMHRRCSPQSLWSRYHRAMADPRTYLPTLLSRPGSVHLAARDTTGRIVAVGHLMPDHTAVEAALLVEDSWQGRGLGTRLLRHLGRHALTGGWETLYGFFEWAQRMCPADRYALLLWGHSRGPFGLFTDAPFSSGSANSNRPTPAP